MVLAGAPGAGYGYGAGEHKVSEKIAKAMYKAKVAIPYGKETAADKSADKAEKAVTD